MNALKNAAWRGPDSEGDEMTIKFEILNRFSGAVHFTAEIECSENESTSVKLGLAVKLAIKSGANLSRADLYGANLSRADLTDAKNSALAIAKTRILPNGDLIGWKKCKNNVIVKLRIPESAKRSHAFGRKCRAEYVDVLEIIGGETATSQHDKKTEYRVGERVQPGSFDEDWQKECSHGIHFFITREEAEEYA